MINNLKKTYYELQEYLKQNINEPSKLDTFGSQKGQIDFLINNVYNYEKNGLPYGKYFIDLAAGDGIKFSNTYYLEKYLDWGGLLIEPNPNFKKSLNENRTSKKVFDCIGPNNKDTVSFRVDNGMLAGIVGDDFDNNNKNRKEELKSAEIIKLKTVRLEDLLLENNSPNHIDYLSLDVEGAEEFVLDTFNFNKYSFGFITIERPTNKLNITLEKNGYIQVKNLKTETFYVPRERLGDLNLNPKIRFQNTSKKIW